MKENEKYFLIDEIITPDFYDEFVQSVDSNKRIFKNVLKELEKS
jgi:hypothetical protein